MLNADAYQDQKDFTINPQLLTALALPSCPETTPEGQALWVYTKMCNLLNYDESYFYGSKDNPNNSPLKSFDVVEQVVPGTFVTCYNFSRLAVKLLNQIAGVNATIIAEGTAMGHFRLGFYTDRVSVDLEPINTLDGYNDLARVKLGVLPAGLKVIYGEKLIERLLQKTVAPLVAANKQDLQVYLQTLRTIPADEEPVQIDFAELLTQCKAHGIDGATLVQLLYNMNRNFVQSPYDLARIGAVSADGVLPRLLIRQEDDLTEIDLQNLTMKPLALQDLQHALATQTMVEAARPFPREKYRLSKLLRLDGELVALTNDWGGREA